MRDLPDCFLSCPPVQCLGAAVPERNHVVGVADEDCVMSQIKQICSFPQDVLAPFAFCNLGHQTFTGSLEVGGPFLNPCFQLIAHPLERLLRSPPLNTYPTGD